MTTGFRRAERKRVWLKLGIAGPTGSGKTYSALKMAFGMGRKIAMVDTENGSGELYAHLGEYDVLTLHAPFTVQKYIDAIEAATAGGYDVLIVDSLSHLWAADGGLLDQKTALDRRGGNSYTNWADITKQYERFKSVLLQSPIHIIGCLRSKMDYVMEENERGKQAPKKVGLAPVMRDGFEYELSLVFDIDMSHGASTSKDRTGLFDGHTKPLSEEDGRRIMQWLESGAEPETAAPIEAEAGISAEGFADLVALAETKGIDAAGLRSAARKTFKNDSLDLEYLTEKQADYLTEYLNKRPDAAMSKE